MVVSSSKACVSSSPWRRCSLTAVVDGTPPTPLAPSREHRTRKQSSRVSYVRNHRCHPPGNLALARAIVTVTPPNDDWYISEERRHTFDLALPSREHHDFLTVLDRDTATRTARATIERRPAQPRIGGAYIRRNSDRKSAYLGRPLD